MTTFSPTPTDADLTARFRPVLDSIAHGAVDRDRNRELPREQIRLLRDAGFTALRVPVEHGGLGATVRQTFAQLTDLAAADPNLTQALRVHFFTVEGFLVGGDAEGLRRAGEGIIYGNAISEKGIGAERSTPMSSASPRTSTAVG